MQIRHTIFSLTSVKARKTVSASPDVAPRRRAESDEDDDEEEEEEEEEDDDEDDAAKKMQTMDT